jgi:hypothetical protein
MANRGFGSRALTLALTLALALTLTLTLALTPLRLWLPLRLRLRLAAIDLGAAVLELAPPMRCRAALTRRCLVLQTASRELASAGRAAAAARKRCIAATSPRCIAAMARRRCGDNADDAASTRRRVRHNALRSKRRRPSTAVVCDGASARRHRRQCFAARSPQQPA